MTAEVPHRQLRPVLFRVHPGFSAPPKSCGDSAPVLRLDVLPKLRVKPILHHSQRNHSRAKIQAVTPIYGSTGKTLLATGAVDTRRPMNSFQRVALAPHIRPQRPDALATANETHSHPPLHQV